MRTIIEKNDKNQFWSGKKKSGGIITYQKIWRQMHNHKKALLVLIFV